MKFHLPFAATVHLLCFFIGSLPLVADDPVSPSGNDKRSSQDAAIQDPKHEQDSADDQFELSADVAEILSPLFVSIKEAVATRATVEMLSDALINGATVESFKGTYQIASKGTDRFTVYLKEPNQRTRIYNDGESLVVALAPDAFFRLAAPIASQAAVFGMPVPMGPYPEPLMALTLAGVDPAQSLVSGMRSVELVGQTEFRGKVPALQIRGVQADEVRWDLWVTMGKSPRPLRMLIDLTPMLLASPEVNLPGGYSHQIRYDFLSWRVTGDVDDKLFTFVPATDAKEYDSLEHYNETIQALMSRHPLLGKKLPLVNGRMLDGAALQPANWQDRIVVLDFWASWHPPCADILPVIKQVTDEFSGRGVQFIAVNIREPADQVTEFLNKHQLDLAVALDHDASIAAALSVENAAADHCGWQKRLCGIRTHRIPRRRGTESPLARRTGGLDRRRPDRHCRGRGLSWGWCWRRLPSTVVLCGRPWLLRL